MGIRKSLANKYFYRIENIDTAVGTHRIIAHTGWNENYFDDSSWYLMWYYFR